VSVALLFYIKICLCPSWPRVRENTSLLSLSLIVPSPFVRSTRVWRCHAVFDRAVLCSAHAGRPLISRIRRDSWLPTFDWFPLRSSRRSPSALHFPSSLSFFLAGREVRDINALPFRRLGLRVSMASRSAGPAFLLLLFYPLGTLFLQLGLGIFPRPPAFLSSRRR